MEFLYLIATKLNEPSFYAVGLLLTGLLYWYLFYKWGVYKQEPDLGTYVGLILAVAAWPFSLSLILLYYACIYTDSLMKFLAGVK